MMRIVVGISGASGAAYGVRLLEKLKVRGDVETHLVVSRPGGEDPASRDRPFAQ